MQQSHGLYATAKLLVFGLYLFIHLYSSKEFVVSYVSFALLLIIINVGVTSSLLYIGCMNATQLLASVC